SQGFNLTLAPDSTPQTSPIRTPFAKPLAMTVAAVNPVEPIEGGLVNFAAPANGATAILYASSAAVVNGRAEITAEPNNALGSYTVVASAGASSASFALTNTGSVIPKLVVNTTADGF